MKSLKKILRNYREREARKEYRKRKEILHYNFNAIYGKSITMDSLLLLEEQEDRAWAQIKKKFNL